MLVSSVCLISWAVLLLLSYPRSHPLHQCFGVSPLHFLPSTSKSLVFKLSLWSILSWFLYVVRGMYLIWFLCVSKSSVDSPVWRNLLYSTLCSESFHQKSVGCMHVDYFLVSVFWYIYLFISFDASPILFNCYSFAHWVWVLWCL